MVRVEEIEYELPERVLTNDDLSRENPSWDMSKVAMRTGVSSRRIAAEGETSFDLAARACDRLFAREDRSSIDAILFCTQTPDYVMPSNAFLLHRHLGLGHGVLAFDYNLACSGFTYGLAIAHGLVAGGLATRVLLVTADTYSKLIHPGDRSARALFGDAAAATLIARSPSTEGLIDFELATAGEHFDRFWIPAGGFRAPLSIESSRSEEDASGNVRTPNNIHMDGMGVWSFINSFVPNQIAKLLDRHNRRPEDVDLYLLHQASRMTLDSVARLLRLSPDQLFSNLDGIGNTVSASLPVLLADARRAGRLPPGSLVVLSGFGVGLSSGSVLMRT